MIKLKKNKNIYEKIVLHVINVKIEINILKWMLKKLMFLFIWIVIINISYISFLNIEIILYKRFDVMDGLKKVD